MRILYEEQSSSLEPSVKIGGRSTEMSVNRVIPWCNLAQYDFVIDASLTLQGNAPVSGIVLRGGGPGTWGIFVDGSKLTLAIGPQWKLQFPVGSWLPGRTNAIRIERRGDRLLGTVNLRSFSHALPVGLVIPGQGIEAVNPSASTGLAQYEQYWSAVDRGDCFHIYFKEPTPVAFDLGLDMINIFEDPGIAGKYESLDHQQVEYAMTMARLNIVRSSDSFFWAELTARKDYNPTIRNVYWEPSARLFHNLPIVCRKAAPIKP